MKCFYDQQQGISSHALLKTFSWVQIDRSLLSCPRARLGDRILFAEFEVRGGAPRIIGEKNQNDDRALVFHTSIDLIDETSLVEFSSNSLAYAVDSKTLVDDIKVENNYYKRMKKVKVTAVVEVHANQPVSLQTDVFDYRAPGSFDAPPAGYKDLLLKRTTSFSFDGNLVTVSEKIENFEAR